MGAIGIEKFNFKLEKVLDYKKGIETNKKNEYGKARQRLNNDEKILNSYNCFKDNIIRERNMSTSNISINDLKMYNNFLLDISNKINVQKEEVHKSKAYVEIKQAELLEATKEKKIFEKLKEYRYDEYLYAMKKEEEKIIDTIVSYRESTR